jgi:predicted enzyme related to lactoylglutathione lyase
MPAKVGYLVIDAADPERLAMFWCGLLAVSVDTTIGDGEFLVLSPTEDGLTVGFQRVAEPKSRKNRLHLDLVVDDLDAATAEIDELGGQWLEPGKTRELEGFRWRCRRGGSTHACASGR